jgi:hypothetical protein
MTHATLVIRCVTQSPQGGVRCARLHWQNLTRSLRATVVCTPCESGGNTLAGEIIKQHPVQILNSLFISIIFLLTFSMLTAMPAIGSSADESGLIPPTLMEAPCSIYTTITSQSSSQPLPSLAHATKWSMPWLDSSTDGRTTPALLQMERAMLQLPSPLTVTFRAKPCGCRRISSRRTFKKQVGWLFCGIFVPWLRARLSTGEPCVRKKVQRSTLFSIDSDEWQK